MNCVRFGWATDAHYSDKTEEKGRFFRESLAKMAEFVNHMNQEDVDFIITSGDIADHRPDGNEESAMKDLQDIETVLRKFNGPLYHVLGNHDLDGLLKKQYLQVIMNTDIPENRTYYSFDHSGVHFIVLDANYFADGLDHGQGNAHWTDVHLPEIELQWLAKDLNSSPLPVIVFVHQQLDTEGKHSVNNAAEVREILQSHKNLLAVFQGHKHDGDFNEIAGIHYYTLKAMVEGSGGINSSYAIVTIENDYSIQIQGFYNAQSMHLKRSRNPAL